MRIDCRIPGPGEKLAGKTVVAEDRSHRGSLSGRRSRHIRESLCDRIKSANNIWETGKLVHGRGPDRVA